MFLVFHEIVRLAVLINFVLIKKKVYVEIFFSIVGSSAGEASLKDNWITWGKFPLSLDLPSLG